MAELANQIAIDTGAARGIGEAISKRLAAMGAHVILVARDQGSLDRVRQEIESVGGSSEVAVLDLLYENGIAALADAVKNHHGRCDILVNNAAIGLLGRPLHEFAPADWDRQMATNLRAPYLMIRAFAPLMIAAK